MGKGDKKSKKGKRWRGSFGKKRNRIAIKLKIKKLASVKKSAVTVESEKPKARRATRKKDSAE